MQTNISLTPLTPATKIVEFATGRLDGQDIIPQFIVMVASASKPSNCMGTYKRVAVVETNRLHMPKQIHPRHKSVVRIIKTWEMLNVGSTERCAFRRALTQAKQLAQHCNLKAQPFHSEGI